MENARRCSGADVEGECDRIEIAWCAQMRVGSRRDAAKTPMPTMGSHAKRNGQCALHAAGASPTSRSNRAASSGPRASGSTSNDHMPACVSSSVAWTSRVETDGTHVAKHTAPDACVAVTVTALLCGPIHAHSHDPMCSTAGATSTATTAPSRSPIHTTAPPSACAPKVTQPARRIDARRTLIR